jgi:hypothetical protein
MREKSLWSVSLTSVFLLIQSVGFPQARQRTVAEVVTSAGDAVVQVVVSDSAGNETALGSGFFVSGDGRIVTNYHVIKGAHSAIVQLPNGSFFPVQGVLGVDADKDLAVLKVPGRNLPFLDLGTIGDLHVGDHVVAIGSPLGLEGTVSDGIISAFRDVEGKSWIQTTAPASLGNSGGPLLDMQGNVVGVITWGVNLQLGQNLNFAAPVNGARDLLSSAHEPKPFDTAAQQGIRAAVPDSASVDVWTSMTTGRDYKVRQDGEYLYTEWVNLPSQLQGTAAFVRSRLKKDSDGRWRGTTHAFLPCQLKDQRTGQARTNWCRINSNAEVDSLSDRRIEGITEASDNFDCRKCLPKDVKRLPFTWIPKD